MSGAPRRPVGWLYTLACFYTRAVFGRKYRLVTDRPATEIKAPALVLCNHESNYDFLITANALLPLKMNFMVTTYFFHHALLKRLLYLMGCIPKRQFLSDPGAIKAALKVIERGDSVCIFPEGQVCYAGLANDIDASIGKLIKRMGVSVAVHTVRGNYLSAPKWARGKKYRGRIESRVELLFTPEQIESLSVGEINEAVARALDYDEFEWQRAARVPYTPARSAEGLESIIYRCPECESDLAMRSNGASLICSKCGYSVSFDEYGFFKTPSGAPPRFDSISSWFRWQRERAAEEYGEGFSYSERCELFTTVEGKQGYERCGEGVMTADSRGLHFEGLRAGEPFELTAAIERQSCVTHSAALQAIDIEGPDANYALAPERAGAMAKFIILYRLARQRHESRAR